jgi:hypothetical protein
VLKHGRPQKGWSIELCCTGEGNGKGGCGARLLVEEGDLFKTALHCRDETDVFATFRCLECGVLTDAPTNEVPPHIFSALKPEKM